MASARALLSAATDPSASALAKGGGCRHGDIGRTTASRARNLRWNLAGKSPAELKRRVVAKLAEVAKILDAKAPGDAPAFKTWLKHMADQVAEAASEGGILGFGGVKVSDAEKASIAEVGKALGVA